MLQALRSKIGSWIVKILFILLILSFGVWGIGDIFRDGGSGTVVAEVGDATISTLSLDREFRQEVNRLRPFFGGALDIEQARAIGLLDQTLQQMIDRTLFDLEASEMGLRVSDEVVAREIRDTPAFRNALGQFDPDVFRRLLAANGLSEQGYVDLVKRDTARELLLGAIGAGAQTPSTLAEGLYRFREERRIADTVFMPNATLPDVGTPTDEQLAQYHEEHAVQFTAPEYRDLTVARLTVDDLVDEIAVSDEDLRAAYEARADEFRTPERRTVSQVVVADRETAEKVAAAAREGATLAAAAQQQGAAVNDLGSVTQDDVVLPELADAAFSLRSGAISDPIESALGWHVVSVSDIEPGGERSFEEVRETLLNDIRRERAADSLFELANRLDDSLAGGATVEEAAGGLGLPVMTVSGVDANGLDPAGEPVTAVPELNEILAVAFDLDEDQESQLQETGAGNYFVVRVDAITPATLRPLDTVREDVAAAWKAERVAEMAATRAEEVVTRIREGADLETVATETGGQVAQTAPLARDTRATGNLPPQLIGQIFDLKIGEIVNAATSDGQVIARLSEVREAATDTASNEIAEIGDALTQAMTADLVSQFAEALRLERPVEINQATLESMYLQN